MTPKEVAKNLRVIQEAYKAVFTPTGQLNISNMARDAADAIDELQAFQDIVVNMPSCGTCLRSACTHRPKPGNLTRYNCPAYIKPDNTK